MLNIYLYYKLPKQLRDVLNRLIPGLIKEPIPVRVSENRNDAYGYRR